MKKFSPRSLVQVHYHDRLSGVNKVIGLYSAAFSRIAGDPRATNIVVCSKSPKPNADFRPATAISVPFCDYHSIPSKSRFERIKTSLILSLERVLTSPRIKPPVCVIGHNLSIGKNCGLSAAFAAVARRYSVMPDRFRFFSIIHDFAEEGRLDCLKEIEKAKNWTNIDYDLFPADGSIRFVTLNDVNAAILENAGFPAAVLHNPVEKWFNKAFVSHAPSLSVPPKGAPKFVGTNGHSSLLFKNDLPVILYPSRCISRKNILEAILLCSFIYKSNLLIGASGTDAKDRAAYKKAVALCAKYKLPVMFDYGRILDERSTRGVFTNKGFDVADACITTSIAEGFGYNLYEPWLYGKAVFGRKHLGFEPIAGVKFDELYDCLPIPIKWISVRALSDKYWEIMQKCFGKLITHLLTPPPSRFYPSGYFQGAPRRGNQISPANKKKFDRAFTDYFIINDTIDFGCLDVSTQFAIVESFIKSPKKVYEWERACEGQLLGIKKSADAAIYKSDKTIRYNQGRVKKYLSIESFSKEFKKVLSQNPPKPSEKYSRDEILRQFCDFDKFRLLLAK